MSRGRTARWCGLLAILALAAGLTLWELRLVPGNSFYDAAVRSMGGSSQRFFFGALEPGGSVSIDKPPLDLWLQVAATKVLGFNLLALHLPEALAGVASVALLFGALREPFGYTAALLGALALAVLPVSVLTARSDTMDCVLAALSIGALWCSWVALRSGRTRWIMLAALIMGVAFNVKLAEALLALPALGVLWWWAAPASPRGRARVLCLAAGVFAGTALSWTIAASFTPSGERPHPIGSGNGSLWTLMLVYNGLDRLTGQGAGAYALAAPGSPPGPLRLLDSAHSHCRAWIGVAVLACLLLGALAVAPALRRRDGSASTRMAIAIGVWFGCGLILFSTMRRLEARYLEMLAPAVSAILGISLASLLRNRRIVLALGSAAAIAALLAAGLSTDVGLIGAHRSDSRAPDPISAELGSYVRAHRGTARYELASATVLAAVGLVSRDGLPVLMLNDLDGQLESSARLRSQVRAGEVRFYFAAHNCSARMRCPRNLRWAISHSTPVARYRGLRRFAGPHGA
ncbi:MAG TPA: glycosyltransferase family 39 protein [Solirubrobacteraceae bacterium]|nr:glycosyltransferase family 39 protein [Solirubrobacteraceae bacterium]